MTELAIVVCAKLGERAEIGVGGAGFLEHQRLRASGRKRKFAPRRSSKDYYHYHSFQNRASGLQHENICTSSGHERPIADAEIRSSSSVTEDSPRSLYIKSIYCGEAKIAHE